MKYRIGQAVWRQLRRRLLHWDSRFISDFTQLALAAPPACLGYRKPRMGDVGSG